MIYCSVTDCDTLACRRGMCQRHYMRGYRRGNFDDVETRLKDRPESYTGQHSEPSSTLAARFWTKVDKRKGDECWNWKNSKDENGYGRLRFNTAELWRAHRVSYYLHFGIIPDDALLDHQCHNPSCVNPAHLILSNSLKNAQNAIRQTTQHIRLDGFQARISDNDGVMHTGPFRFNRDDAARDAMSMRQKYLDIEIV